jgi:hypothetical protein
MPLSITPPPAPVKVPGLLLELLRAGYKPGSPARVSLDAQSIDAQTCQEARCPECLSPLAYRPFHRGGSYRVVGLCTSCGETEEF